MAEAIEAGRYPAFQQGEYDLRLDRAGDRDEWRNILQSMGSTNSTHLEQPAHISVTKEVKLPNKINEPRLARQDNKNKPAQNATVDGGRTTLYPETDIICKADAAEPAPLAVIIPIRNRAGQRLRNALYSLNWQAAGRPQEILVVSHGSRLAINDELSQLCFELGGTLLTIGTPNEQWNKPLALNVGIRAISPDVPFLMTMDADMILAPNFLTVVLQQLNQKAPALVLFTRLSGGTIRYKSEAVAVVKLHFLHLSLFLFRRSFFQLL